MNKLKKLLKGKKPIVTVSAHNGLSAKLAENAGFDALWASGFEISATYGFPDNGELTLTEMLNVVKQLVDSTDLPIIVDCDEGYGGLHNAKRTGMEMERIGAAAICIEDNVFPKKHSFWANGQKMATKEFHGSKIKIIKDNCKDLLVIGRTEALIRGLGMKEALTRAKYYDKCGADMILMHSRESTGGEAINITKQWKSKTPLVIVPTKFPHMTNKTLYKLGFKVIVWANHTLRLSLKAVKEGLQELRIQGNAEHIEESLGSLEDIYSLTDVKEMEEDEKRYS